MKAAALHLWGLAAARAAAGMLLAAAWVPAAAGAAAPAATAASAASAATATIPLRHELLDDFRHPARWQATASDQVHAALRTDPRDASLCLDYDFAGHSGFAVMRRVLPMAWPAHFELQLRLKGAGATNDVQIKLVDASGDNVWWVNRPNLALPAALTPMKFKQRHFSFAWGPGTDRTLKTTQFIEFVVAAGRDGGRGSLCVAQLTLAERAPDLQPWPEPVLRQAPGLLELDFGLVREFNGLALRWPAAVRRVDYEVLASDDGRHWRSLRRVDGSDGGLDALYLPESEARHLRVQVNAPSRAQSGAQPGAHAAAPSPAQAGAHSGSQARAQAPARGRGPLPLPTLELRNAQQWPDFNAVLAELAQDAPRGALPRAFLGQQNYWALVGVDGGGARSALLSEDGAIEIGRGGFSVEPALQLDDGRTLSWADVQVTQTLRDGYLPLPAVHWRHADFSLDIEAAADGTPEAPQALARYTVTNLSERPRDFVLLLALRPWQVNPPQQFLATPGGASPVRELQWQDDVLAVNGRRMLRPSEAPQSVQALPFDGGLGLDALQAGAALGELKDAQQAASALLRFAFTLRAGEKRTLGWAAPLGTQAAPDEVDAATLDLRYARAAEAWRERLNRVTLGLPATAQAIADTLRSALAQILISRDGPALKPGTRSYARSWVRDGAMMAAGLLRLGEADAARDFVDWFAGFVFASGKVPCCVDARGADPVAENDSHGQYLYAVAEVWRHTHDNAFLARHWPTVQKVLTYQEGLRLSERGPRNHEPERAHLFGLLPPSISHEGYSDKPAYAYWDDFWALRGYKDAVAIALVLGHDATALQWAAWAEEFERELGASITAAAAHHGLEFIPGAADRGDFDATSTTIALNPVQANLPPALLHATFERYWQQAQARAEGRLAWKDYTPYELRNVGALARLGQGRRAHALLDFFMRDRRPQGWKQWAEVVRPGYRERGFIGDLPHAWVASDYIRSALDLFAYEREADASVVIGAGWQADWLASGLALRGLSTAYGVLSYRLDRVAGGWRFALLRALPGARGGLRLRWPEGAARPRAMQGGRTLSWNADGELLLPATPLTLDLIAE